MIRAALVEFGRAARERRSTLLWTALAIVALEALAFVAMGNELTTHVADALPALAVAIAGFAVATDLFGRDLRSGAHALVLRTPGAFRGVVVGRVLLLLVVTAAAAGLAAAGSALFSATIRQPRDWFLVVKAVVDGEQIWERRPLPPDLILGVRTPWIAAAQAATAMLWVALGSSWTRRRPPAALLGSVPFAALIASCAVVTGDRFGFFPVMPIDNAIIIGGLALTALAALAWGWTGGRRFLAGGFGCAARGLVVVGVVIVAADVTLAAALSHWLDLKPGDPDVRIRVAVLGTSRRHLAVELMKGDTAAMPQGAPEKPHRWTRPFTWIVDLDTGTWNDLGIRRQVSLPRDAMGYRASLDPQPWIVCERHSGFFSQDWFESWIDGKTGEVRLTRRPTDSDKSEPNGPLAWRREIRRANTPVRDAAGRRAWTMGRRVERDGEAPGNEPLADTDPLMAMKPAPGGWFGPWGGTPSGATGWAFLDADTGAPTFVAWPEGDLFTPVALDRTATLRGVREPGPGKVKIHWAFARIPKGPDRIVGAGIPYENVPIVVSDGLVLASVPRGDPDGDRDVVLWRPETDERRVLAIDGLPPGGWRFLNLAGRRSDGPWLVALMSDWRTTAPAVSYVLVDSAVPKATALTGWVPRNLEIVAVDDDRSLVAIEDERRVVRFGPKPGERTVIFPRADAAR